MDDVKKRTYKKPMAKMISYCYNEQVVAYSMDCDQGWTKKTTSTPQMRTTYCDRCFSDLIWINQLR